MIERFAQMPAALRANARWQRLGPSQIPALLVHPNWDRPQSAPLVIWMHGRTADKELDPGRYLRWMRTAGGGIGTCAVDLPGHGERFDPIYQDGSRSLELIKQMVDEVDEVVTALLEMKVFDASRLAIGGMSAGGMAAMARLCRPHPFVCASIEAATGSWRKQYQSQTQYQHILDEMEPISHLEAWREIPFQAIHSKADELIPFAAQAEFVEKLRSQYGDPSRIDFVVYEKTGSPREHLGFGRLAAEAKDRQRDFFRRYLMPEISN